MRWTEYSFSLANAKLIFLEISSYITLLNSREKECNEFLLLLTNKDTIFLLVFLADDLAIFSRYQQTSSTYWVRWKKPNSLGSTNLLGGWVNVLEDGLKGTDRKVLKGLKLIGFQEKRKHIHNLYVTENRSVSAKCHEIVEILNRSRINICW